MSNKLPRWSALPESLAGYKYHTDYFEIDRATAMLKIMQLRGRKNRKVKSKRSAQGTLIREYFN